MVNNNNVLIIQWLAAKWTKKNKKTCKTMILGLYTFCKPQGNGYIWNHGHVPVVDVAATLIRWDMS